MCFCRFALPLFLMAGFAAGSLNFFPAVAVAGEIEFNRDIRPILAENCFYCHGQDENKRQGDLRLDAPNEATEWIVDRILSDDPETQMPPGSAIASRRAATLTPSP